MSRTCRSNFVSCLPTSCQGPSPGLCFLLLTAHGRRTCQPKAHMCAAQPDAQPDTVTHIHVEDCIITSITSNLLHPQACLTSSCSLSCRIALQMVQNKLAEQSTQKLCIGAMSCHVQAESHAFCTSGALGLCAETHTHCDVTCCRFCTC